jgi:hypothetical protein
MFFATHSDLLEAAEAFEANHPVQYVLCKMDERKEFPMVHRLRELQSLGFTTSDSHIGGDFYMIQTAGTEVKIEEIPQRRGGVMYAVGQSLNPCSIILRPGGIYQDGVLICGSCGTISNANDSRELYRTFRRSLSKVFREIKGYYIGCEAYRSMQNGWRLITMHIREDQDYDFKE